MSTSYRPVLAALMGHFSTLAKTRNWRNLEEFFNPCGAFSEVHIVALGDDYQYQGYRFGTIYVHPVRSLVRTPSLKLLNNIYLIIAGILRLMHLVRMNRIDLIAQIDATPLKYGLPAVIVARWAGLPSVITLCSDYHRAISQSHTLPLQRAIRYIWRYLFKNCTRVRSKGAYIAGFAYSFGVPREKVSVIPNKEILDTFHRVPEAYELKQASEALEIADLIRDSVVFLSVGRLLKVKNLERQLRAFALAAQRQVNLVYLIVGEGPLEAQLKALAQELGIAQKVRFLGYLSHDQLRLIYHLSDVFLFATLYEGHPRAVIEATLSNLPIICANYGEVCNMVEDGRDGLWVDPLDVDAISRAIAQLAADEKLRVEMSLHGGLDVEQFSSERVSAQEAELYLSAISRSERWSADPGRSERTERRG